MSLAIETVVIVVTVVSLTLLGVIAFALYWLWRLFLEDKRCSRFESASHRTCLPTTPGYAPIEETAPQNETPCRSSWRIPNILERPDNAPLASPNSVLRILRQSEVIVDERKRRMIRIKTQTSKAHLIEGNCRGSQNSRICSNGSPSASEIVVIDGTEPPPPYEVTRWQI